MGTEEVEGRSAWDMALIERLEKLYVAVVSDCLDSVEVRDNVLAPHVRSLYPGAVVAGYALTVHAIEVDAIPSDRERWYQGELGAVDSQRPGDVMVVSTCNGSYWGELLATASRYRGARGLVGDCYARDIATLVEMRYPTFVAGALASDSLGRIDVDAVGVPIECAGVTVHPGDLVLGDDDGVVIIPHGVAEEVIRLAEEKASSENLVRDRLALGMSATEAFKTFGVL